MLKHPSNLKNIALVGAASEIGNEIIKFLTNESLENLYIFGRDNSQVSKYREMCIDTKFFQLDVEDINYQKNLLIDLNSLGEIDLAIIAIGFLPPENQDLDSNQVLRSMMINATGSSVILSIFANKMLPQKSGKILYVSTVASMRPRLKNFTYGASKKAADFFVQGLQAKYKKSNLKIILLRPGYVYTKMSSNFQPAPFAVNKNEVAMLAIRGIKKNKDTVYAPSILFILMNLVVKLPRFIFNKLD